MKPQITITLIQALVLLVAGIMFTFAGMYLNKLILSLGFFIVFLASIFLTRLMENKK